ncbi:MAG: mechanosensitive ion channel family protein [Rhodobacteraceae bacterium]|nr:mechanosensitive ion channel family protein [Paracoccaceae bacterium]
MIRLAAVIRRLLLCMAVCAGLVAAPAVAQIVPAPQETEAPTDAGNASPNDIRELMRLLADPQIQNWLEEAAGPSEELTANAAKASFRQIIETRLAAFGERVESLGLAWKIIPRVPEVLGAHWESQLSPAQKVRSLTYLLTFLVIGFGLEWLYRRYLDMALLRIELAPKEAPLQKLAGAASRAAIILGGLLVFAIGSIGTFEMFHWPPLVAAVVLDFLTLVLVVRAILTLSLFVQAPFAPELRLVPYGTPVAKHLHRLLCVLSVSVGLAVVLSFLLARMSAFQDMAADLQAVVLAQSVMLAGVILLVAWGCIWIGFRRVPRLTETPCNPSVTRFWRNYALVSVGAAFGFWLIGAFAMMWTLVIVGLAVPGLRLLAAWIDHFFDQSTAALHEQHEAEAAAELAAFEAAEAARQAEVAQEGETQDSALAVEPPAAPEFHDPYATTRPIVKRAARFVLLIAAVLALASVWGVNILSLSEDRSMAGRALEVLVDSFVALLFADLVWTWAKTVIDKRIADYEPPVDGQAPGPEARMITLLPLLRTILMVTLLTMVGLSVLTALGVNIAPLLAGAGILGIAIGFGTQSLVRDIVAGIFFLIDDAFRLGEYIEVGDLVGTVESISIRSMRIRHHRGKVHTVPYGELKSLTNHSRDWVIMKLEFRVPFDTDLMLVKKLVKKVGAELKANEHYGPSILSTLKSQGVRRMEEFNMVVGVKFMTKPGEQWLVRRDAYQKVRDIFEANGIRMAERNVKVEIAGGDQLDPDTQKAVAGAAQDAIDKPAGPPKPVPDEP